MSALISDKRERSVRFKKIIGHILARLQASIQVRDKADTIAGCGVHCLNESTGN
jgi:hypothetical protein